MLINFFRECKAEGLKTYNVDEAIQITKGIKTGTNLRFEKKVSNFFNVRDTVAIARTQ